MKVPLLVAKPSRGFTLLELLLSVTLLALLVSFLFPMVDAAARLWRDNEQRVDSFREARAGMNVIARELGLILRHSDPAQPNLLVNPSSGDVQISAQVITDAEGSSRIFFLNTLSPTAQDPSANKSDICGVGYYLAFTNDFSNSDPTGQSGSCKLYRYFRTSDSTYQALIGTPGDQPLFQGVGPTFTSRNEILARNIASFRVVPMRYNGTKFETQSPWPQHELPAALEISITALNTEAAARVTTRNDWLTQAGSAFRENSQTFVLHIDVQH